MSQELRESVGRSLGPKCLTSVKMAKEQSFMTRLLPDEQQLLGSRELEHSSVALSITATLVAVEENRSQ
jgi:hypothetical protein